MNTDLKVIEAFCTVKNESASLWRLYADKNYLALATAAGKIADAATVIGYKANDEVWKK